MKMTLPKRPVFFYTNTMIIEQTIEISPNHRLVLDLPFELPLGRARIEITVTPEKNETVAYVKSAFGCLHRFADPEKIADEKGAWAQAAIEKYANN
jgi:hypothetical protein